MPGKKAFLYATDIDAYMKDRGTYFSLEELPAPLTVSNDELEKAVEQYDVAYYEEKIRVFMEETIRNYNNAHGAERVVDYILRKIN